MTIFILKNGPKFNSNSQFAMDRLDLYHHLLLSEGAYYFKIGQKAITKKIIKDVFSDVVEGRRFNILAKIIRQSETIEAGDDTCSALCSLLVFRQASVPLMFDFDEETCPKEVREMKISYILIVEIRGYVVIVKRNVSHLTKFIDSLESISAKVIASVLVKDSTDFQQIKLANMNASKDAIRTKSYEANNLQISMPMFGTNQNMVTTIRFVNDNDGTCSVNIGTSHIAKFGGKKGLNLLLQWMNFLVSKLENYVEAENFLTRFAMPYSWKEVGADLLPTSLLINIFDLQNYISETLDDKSIYRMVDKDSYRDFSDCFWRMLREGSESFELTRSTDTQFMYKSIGVAKLVNGLNIATKKPLDSLYYKDNVGRYLSLKSLINTLRCFTVCFSDFSYVYAYGKLCRNSEIEKDFDSISAVLEPIDAIRNVTSEKGEGYGERNTEFTTNSLFYVVEHELYDTADILLCDDMGNEWADHIAINNDTISFIHSKCKEREALSASYFQDVIGQAIKNIGNMNPNTDTLQSKIDSMRGTWKNTGIQKCRRGNVDDIAEVYQRLMSNPNKKREVCLAVNFLSKNGLSAAFDKIKNQISFRQKNSVVQLAWLLNGFISTCKEADLHCKIYCRI